IVTGRAIGAKGDIDASLRQAMDRAAPAGQFEIGLWAVNDMSSGFKQQFHIAVINLGHMHTLRKGREHSQVHSTLDRSLEVLLKRFLRFEAGFLEMDMDRGVHLLSKDRYLLQNIIRDGIGCVGPKSYIHQMARTEVVVQSKAFSKVILRPLAPG